ncbi:TonB-dependent receptor [Sphingomonas sp. SFZ2018-12]|uniref:TonB-dependent receptor n=1 Tax=Sphingomonas sp. SFZ2018-12 TaxID=2683197 RepID=UPI001F0D86D3|nr:TonB-dependent receptor [Sphingomonas sp. SFZ2018-12]
MLVTCARSTTAMIVVSLASLSSLSPAARAQSVAGAASQRPETPPDEEIYVTGRRVSDAEVAIGTDQTTSTISITREALLSAPAGISGLKMLEGLPGFNVQANDALGLYEFGNSVFVRAFNFQQIGFVLDGVPMGRSDQFGGSPIFRYVENENLERVTASPGAGDVSLPSYASLGPIVQYFTTDPDDEMGATSQFTVGADSFTRGYLRLDTGNLGGFSAYASYSKLDADVWRGPGTIDREHVEAKARYAFGDHAIRARFLYNDYFDFDSPAISQAQYEGTAGDPFGRSGRYFAYLAEVPVLAPLATATTIPFSNALYNQYFKQAINSRTDYLYSVSGDFQVTGGFSFKPVLYYEDKKGYGVSPEAYATSLASHNAQRLIVPGLFAPRGLQYGLSTIEGTRYGVVGDFSVDVGPHLVQFGFWGENDDYHRTQDRFNHANGNPDGEPLLNEPVHRQRDYVSTRETLQLHAKLSLNLLDDRLKLDLGAKGLTIGYEIRGYRNPADYIARRQPRLTDRYEDLFLPQVGAVFNITRREQIFASYSENMALPRGADDIFSAASPLAPGPDAETSKNYELGFRTNRPAFNASLALFYTRFDNRLQSFAAPVPGSPQLETFFQNVGSVESYGAELTGIVKPVDFLYVNANVTYNIAKFLDNYSTLSIAGNRVPDNAEWLVQAGVTIEPTSWLVANFSGRYLSERNTNFINSQQIPGYAIFNAYVDFGEGIDAGPFKAIRIRANVDNLFNKDYLGTINVATTGLATFRPGPDRTWQLSIRADL